MSNIKKGKQGEEIACKYLQELGYTIIERNIHFSRYCELDILALDKKKTLIAIEVKTRSNNYCGTPFEAITKQKYNNIKTGLYTYLNNHPEYKSFQIDAISIILFPKISIEHLKNISI